MSDDQERKREEELQDRCRKPREQMFPPAKGGAEQQSQRKFAEAAAKLRESMCKGR